MRARWFVLPPLVAALGIQLVPYGRGGDPPVGREAPWPSAEARRIAVESCYDCHSRTPERPWFTQVAPASWLVQRDIDDARAVLDFTNWGEGEQELEEDVVEDGSMPPRRYLLLHPGAKLSAEEARVLANAIEALDEGDSGGRGRSRGRGRGGDD